MTVLDCDEHPEYDFNTERTIEDGLKELAKSLGYTKEETNESINHRTGKGGPKAKYPLGYDDNYVLDGFVKQ